MSGAGLAVAGSDPRALRRGLRKGERTRQAGAVLLVLPLLLFLLLSFVGPIGAMLLRGVTDPVIDRTLPRTVQALRGWDGRSLPQPNAFAALAQDLRAARDAGTLPAIAARLNEDIAGLRTVVFITARKLSGPPPADPRAALLNADPAWGHIESWGAIRRASGTLTDYHVLAALDLKRTAAGAIHQVPRDQRIFREIFIRSFTIAGTVTLVCLLLGYPVAALLNRCRGRIGNILMLAVLLPFWTSLLVRTAAWMVLLAQGGVVNSALISLGIIGAPMQLLYNRFAVVLAMVHILLPFMILPLAAVMRQVPTVYARAAASLGAGPVRTFFRIWLPQTMPGVGAGAVMVFIQSLGFYVTPALIGGGTDQMLPYFIGFYANQTVNWGLAAALSLLLLVAIAVLAALWGRVVGFGLGRFA